MDENSLPYPLQLEKGHQILGPDYCSGYADIFGKWNTGFYCPQTPSGETVFCCGNPVVKYCCTAPEQPQPQPIPNTNTYDEDQNVPDVEIKETTTAAVVPIFEMNAPAVPVVVGVICGVLVVTVFVVLVSCLYCSCCILYKKRRESMAGGIYRMQGSSTTSGLINTCSSPLNVNSVATTPLDPEWSAANTTALTQALANNRRNLGSQVNRSIIRVPAAAPVVAVINSSSMNGGYAPRGAPPSYNYNQYPAIPANNATSAAAARLHNHNLINQLVMQNNLSRMNSGPVPRFPHNGLYFPTSPCSTISSVSSFPTQFSYRTVPRNRNMHSREDEIPRNPENGLNNLSAPPRRHRATSRCNSTCSDPCSNRNLTVARKPRQLPLNQNFTPDLEKILNISTSSNPPSTTRHSTQPNSVNNSDSLAASALLQESRPQHQQSSQRNNDSERGSELDTAIMPKPNLPLTNTDNNIHLSQHSLHT